MAQSTGVPFVYLDNVKAAAHKAEWKKWFKDNFVP